MAHSSECRDGYAQKVLDTADIVREEIYRQRSQLPDLIGVFHFTESIASVNDFGPFRF
jgi:hypothetical protein